MKFETLFPNIKISSRRTAFVSCCETTSKNEPSEWIKMVTALANCRGGDIYVGVNPDTHDIGSLNKEEAEKQVDLIQKTAKEEIDPPLLLNPVLVPTETNKVAQYLIKIHVDRTKPAPVMLKNGTGQIYKLWDGKLYAANNEDIMFMVYNSEECNFDTYPSDEIYDQNSFRLLKEEYEEYHWNEKFNDDSLKSIGFFDEDKKLTKGALLFRDDYRGFTTELAIVKWIGFSRGADILYYMNRMSEPVTKTIRKTVEIVSALGACGRKKGGICSANYFSYPYRSIVEGIAYAFLQRNLWFTGTQIQIDVFPDHLQILIPSPLIDERIIEKEENLSALDFPCRNSLFKKVFDLLGILPEGHSVFKDIAEDYKDADESHRPYFSANECCQRIILPNLVYEFGLVSEDEPFPEVYPKKGYLPVLEMRILSYCYNAPHSREEIAKALGVRNTTHFGDVIWDLVKKGYLGTSYYEPYIYHSKEDMVGAKP